MSTLFNVKNVNNIYNEHKTSLMSFGKEFQIRDLADWKPREASVVLRRGSTRWAEEDRSDRVLVQAWKRDDR